MIRSLKLVEIRTPRFFLRRLKRHDATSRYSAWLDEQQSGFIQASRQTHSIEDLRQYISDRMEREDVLFLGIFNQESMEHIGNIKFEPIDYIYKTAVMGILIGESSWRGKGVAVEVIKSSADWLHHEMDIQTLTLGVDAENTAAIRAYEKSGFKLTHSEHSDAKKQLTFNMVLHLGDKLL